MTLSSWVNIYISLIKQSFLTKCIRSHRCLTKSSPPRVNSAAFKPWKLTRWDTISLIPKSRIFSWQYPVITTNFLLLLDGYRDLFTCTSLVMSYSAGIFSNEHMFHWALTQRVHISNGRQYILELNVFEIDRHCKVRKR